jgi:methionyl-tRNA formyltransferase
MNVFIITQEEPFFIPKIIRRISDSMEKEDKIVGITILKPYHKGKNYLIWIKERAVVYLIRELFFLMILMIYVKVYEIFAGVFTLKKYFSVKRFCGSKNFLCVDTDDINSSEYQSKIRPLDIDVIISISATQIFKKALIDLPKKECVNIHGTFLPRHRGVLGSWWALAAGDEYTGVTVHRIIEKLDAGDILLQEKIPIQKDDTQFSLAVRTKKMSADLTVKLIDIIKKGNIIPKRMDQNIANINTFPTIAQAKQFRRSGKRVIKINDFPAIIYDW